MGIKRVVNTDFWTDSKVIDMFSAEDKYFMLYLLTNPHTTQLGIYEFNIKQASFETGYTTDVIAVLLERFENKYKIIKYSKESKEIAVGNYLRHSIIKGGKPVEDLLKKEIAKVKDKSLLSYSFSRISEYDDLNETVVKIIESIYLNENDNENENDNDNDESSTVRGTNRGTNRRTIVNYKQIAEMYNSICVSYPMISKPESLSESRKKAIRARLNTYSIEDFRRLFELAESSDFLKGKNNRNWSANFDWLIKDANMPKVLDGNYNESGRGNMNVGCTRTNDGNVKVEHENELLKLAREAGVDSKFEGF